KPEQILRPWHDPSLTGFPLWYYPLSFSASGGNDMLSLCRALTRLVQGADTGRLPASRCQDRSLVVDVTLVPAPPLTPVEQEEIAAWGAFAEKWGRDQKVPVAGGLYSKARTMEIAADPQAGEVKKAFGEQLARYGTPGQRAFLYAVRAVTLCSPGTDWGRGAARAAATALAGGALSAGSGCQILDVLPDHPAFERAVRSLHGCYVTPSVCNGTVWEREDAPETLRRLHRLALLGEISPFFRLPIPGREGCPGMPLDAGLPRRGAPTPGYASLRIGQFIEGDRVTGEAATVAVRDLAKHCLIVGTPGSGKTSLAFNLLTQLWRDHRIPFLVLEPAKTEYRSLLAVPGMGEDLLVFSVGNERVAPLRLNPFEILSGVPVAEHVAALTACFAGAFHLPDPLPMLLDEALREIYADRGWSEYGAGGDDPDLEPPTLADLHRKAIAVAERSGYRGDTGGNVRAMLQVRLQSLLRGPKGRCFGARRSLPVDLLLRRPVVFELESLTDEEKALTMMLLLVQVREHARATRKSGADLSHVVLVEEAHNLLGSGAGRGGGESADPKAMAVRYFTRMLAEMRSLGEGLIIADQLPTALAPEVVKNTNVKVMHRLTASDDREVLGRTMVLDPAQFEQAASLPPGLSYVFQEGWSRSRFVLEPDFKKETGTENSVTGDAEVRERMEALQEGDETVRRAFLPYSGCSATCRRCRPALRERMERWAAGKLPLLHQALRDFAGEDPIGISYPFYLDGIEAVADVADTVERACAQIHYAESVLPAVVMAQNSAAQTHR
ncbi:MAG: ATP-binding protein, partial [Armatimonadota bacterium]